MDTFRSTKPLGARAVANSPAHEAARELAPTPKAVEDPSSTMVCPPVAGAAPSPTEDEKAASTKSTARGGLDKSVRTVKYLSERSGYAAADSFLPRSPEVSGIRKKAVGSYAINEAWGRQGQQIEELTPVAAGSRCNQRQSQTAVIELRRIRTGSTRHDHGLACPAVSRGPQKPFQFGLKRGKIDERMAKTAIHRLLGLCL